MLVPQHCQRARDPPVVADDQRARDHTEHHGREQRLHEARRQQIVAGLGYRFSDSRTGGPPTVAFEPPKRADALYNAFVEDSIEVVPDRVQLTLGSKFERNDYSGFEWQPSARLGWSPRADHFFWGAVSRTVRTPSRLDRDLAVTVAASASAPVFIRVLGTPTFESERAVVYEAGYRFRLGDRALLDLAAFHNHYPNLSSIEPGAPLREPGRQIIPFQIANGLGLTSLQEASASEDELAAYAAADAQGRLTARVVASIHCDTDRGVSDVPRMVALRGTYRGKRLRADSVKIFADGVLEQGNVDEAVALGDADAIAERSNTIRVFSDTRNVTLESSNSVIVPLIPPIVTT